MGRVKRHCLVKPFRQPRYRRSILDWHFKHIRSHPRVVCFKIKSAYGRHQICQPMRIEAPIFFFEEKKNLSGTTPRFYGSKSWSTNAPVHQLNTFHAWTIHGCNFEQLRCFKAQQIGLQVHQSTSWTPPTRGWSMYVELSDPGSMKLSYIQEQSPRNWETSMGWNVVLTIFHTSPCVENCQNHTFIFHFSPILRLETNNTLQCSSDSFLGMVTYILCLESCHNYILMHSCLPIAGRLF